MNLRISQAAAFQAGATAYIYSRMGHDSQPTASNPSSTGAAQIQLANALSNVGGRSLSGVVYLVNPAGTTKNKNIFWQIAWLTSVPAMAGTDGVGVFGTNTTAIDGVRFLMSAGNITSGTFALYGVRKT